jgi:hypothetical protein
VTRTRWTRLTTPARWLLGAYAAFLLVVLLSPDAHAQSGSVAWVDRLLQDTGAAGAWWSPTRVEFAMNALVVAPVPVLGSVVLPRWTWRDWTAAAFCGAAAIEIVQGLLLSGRSATYVDVVANTVGVLVASVAMTGMRTQR